MSELERALHRLAADVDWPDDDIAARVRDRLAEPAPLTRPQLRRWPRVAWLAASLALVLTVVASVAPVRDRVADALSLIGITFERDGAAGLDLPAELDLGEAITVDEAPSRTEAAFFVATVGRPPDGVFVDESFPGGMVSFVWRPDGRFPEIGETGVGLVTSHFLGEDVALVKSLGPDVTLERVMLRGVTAWWVSGAPHEIGREVQPGLVVAGRAAANVLVWTEGDTTHRVETAADLETVLSVIPAR